MVRDQKLLDAKGKLWARVCDVCVCVHVCVGSFGCLAKKLLPGIPSPEAFEMRSRLVENPKKLLLFFFYALLKSSRVIICCEFMILPWVL